MVLVRGESRLRVTREAVDPRATSDSAKLRAGLRRWLTCFPRKTVSASSRTSTAAVRTAPAPSPSVRYLVDTDWLIDAAIGRPHAQHLLERLRDDGLAISIIAVADVYEGAFGTPDPQPTLDGLCLFPGDFAILPVTDPIVEQFAPRSASRVNVFPTRIC